MIDIATGIDSADLERIVQNGLERELFSRAEAMARLAEPDMLTHLGAGLLRNEAADSSRPISGVDDRLPRSAHSMVPLSRRATPTTSMAWSWI